MVGFLAGRPHGGRGEDTASHAAQLPALVALPLPGVLHTVLMRSGAVELHPGMLQDAVNAAVLAICAYGMHLMEAASRSGSSRLLVAMPPK